jgi:16S rRNA (cytosine967-C5)-methyltransferase
MSGSPVAFSFTKKLLYCTGGFDPSLQRTHLKQKTEKTSATGRRHAATRASVAREIALHVLLDVSSGRFAEHVLSVHLDRASPSSEDRALATELVYGVLRWQKRLDAVLHRCLDRPGKKLDTNLGEILGIAMYQILLLDRVPDHAVVDQAVIQTRRHCGSYAAPFVNGILRNALRKREALDPFPGDDAGSLAEYYSHPLWLVTRWLKQHGPDATRKILIHNNSRAPIDIRVNRIRATPERVEQLLAEEGAATRTIPLMPNCLQVAGLRGPVRALPGYEQGFFTVQARASQMIVPLLAAKPGERILDACAAPGGKTAQLAEQVENNGLIVAVDVDPIRLEDTRENLQRLGVRSVELRCGDVSEREFVSSLGTFDRILLDAPCSNVGVLRHNPEVKYRLGPHDPTEFAERQFRMLEATAAGLKHGGTLVYSVCTTTTEETFGVISRFLNGRDGYTLVPVDPNEVPSSKLIDPRGFFSTFPPPDDNPLDGFFAARIRRA